MDKIAAPALAYFQPPQNYFWRWAEKGAVIEWMDGATICYREDLAYLLQQLSRRGLPRLGSVVMVLAACRDEWQRDRGGLSTLAAIKVYMEAAGVDLFEARGQFESVSETFKDALAFLDVVSKLPREYRTGIKRGQLLLEIFDGAAPQVIASESRLLIGDFESGQLDELLFDQPPPRLSTVRFAADLSALRDAFKKFPAEERLELKLRTGLSELPVPAEIELPAPTSPSADLLEQLSADPKTAALARLAQRLVAALNIPMHAQGSSDQSFGGVSDISNRGNFDRLLLSELAHDDHTLTARLANNEALYLRREELPSNRDHRRFILIDTTLKMWGTPRVFALAAALACARKRKADTSLHAFALGGRAQTALDLETKEGVTSALEQIDPALHCGDALTRFLGEQERSGANEYFFITGESIGGNPVFLPFLTEAQHTLNYVITVARDGSLQFSECIAGRKKALSTAKLDLDELLASPVKTGGTIVPDDAPAFFKERPAPLFLPPAKVLVTPKNTHVSPALGIFSITQDRRLLRWKNKSEGARELCAFIEKGEYFFGTNERSTLFLLVRNHTHSFLKLYSFYLDTGEMDATDFPGRGQAHAWTIFDDGLFYIQHSGGACSVLDPLKGTLELADAAERAKIHEHITAAAQQQNNVFAEASHVNRSSHTLSKLRDVYVNEHGELALDQRRFTLSGGAIVLSNPKNERQPQQKKIRPVVNPASMDAVAFPFYKNKQVRFTRYTWKCGSTAILDSRGLLHLKSCDRGIPEITLLLLADKACAGWAADGKVFGLPYYTGLKEKGIVAPPVFMVHYLEPFIERLR